MTIPASKADAPIPSGLPTALRPWSQVFEDMPEAHLRLIGSLMGQLNALLRETFAIDAHSYGEFNGYDGMAMRGEIERLLPSEWLWRELAPQEFLRRFAEQELLYHRPFFESPTDERTHLVAVDCGPGMLGRPRLVALAALLCLSAMARAQGAKLLWTAPHADVQGWQALLRQSELKAFLLSANPVSLRAGELDELVRSLPDGQGDEKLVLWTIGAVPLSVDETIQTNQIVISEKMTLTPDGQPAAEARVELISGAGGRNAAVFGFPGEDDCVSLLREPFSPPRVRSASGVTRARDGQTKANPFWAPREVIFQENVGKLILRVRDGVLGLTLNADGTLEYPVFIKLESSDDLLGLHWGQTKVILAVMRKYDGFFALKIRRHEFYRTAAGPQNPIREMRLEEDNSIVIDKHPINALPPLIRPGRKFRLLALTATGQQYVLGKSWVEPFAHLRHLPLIGCQDDCSFMLAGSPTKQVLIARSLNTLQCTTFALAPNAAVRDMRDIVYWPAASHQPGSAFLLARCDDGHWRGQAGKAGQPTHDQFSRSFVDVDLSALGQVMPVGQQSIPLDAAYDVWFASPNDTSLHRCRCTLTQGGAADIQQFDAMGIRTAPPVDSSKPETWKPRLAVYGAFAIGWQTDVLGYVTRIDGGVWRGRHLYVMLHHDVAELIGKARCLSD